MLFCLTLLDSEEEKNKFANLYEYYKGLMLHISYDILKDYHYSNDAVHEAFIKIANHIEKIGEIKSQKTKSFISVVIKNVALNMYKQKHKERETFSYYEEMDEEDVSLQSADESYFKSSSVEEIVSKIKQLPEKYSSVLVLRYLHEKTDGEIGEILNISKENARKRIERARKLLRNIDNNEKSEMPA